MEYATPVVERISGNFRKHNPYVIEAINGGNTESSYATVYALLAIAYELSQMRYHLTHRDKDVTDD